MSKIKLIVREIIKDNGVIKGLNLMFWFGFQRIFSLPKRKIYSYFCSALNKEAKLIYTSDIGRGLPFVEVFSVLHYYHSVSKNLVFKLNKNSKVLDLGAFIGDSTVFFALQGATVYSYEPQKTAYNLVLKNLEINNLSSKVKIFNSAVSSSVKEIKFNPNSKISDSYSISNSKGDEISKSVSLSSVLDKEKSWDLIKIDIEGEEWSLIEYLIKNKRELKKIRGIIIELHGKNDELLKEFIKSLKNLDFKIELEYEKDLGMFWAKKY